MANHSAAPKMASPSSSTALYQAVSRTRME